MLSFRAVLVLNFVLANYRKWLRKQELFNFFLFLVSLGRVYFVLVLTSTNHKARNRYPGYGSDWRISVYVYVYSTTNLVAREPREYCAGRAWL